MKTLNQIVNKVNLIHKEISSPKPNYNKLIEYGYYEEDQNIDIIVTVFLTEYQSYNIPTIHKAKDINTFKKCLYDTFIEINSIEYKLLFIEEKFALTKHAKLYFILNIMPCNETKKPENNYIVIKKESITYCL